MKNQVNLFKLGKTKMFNICFLVLIVLSSITALFFTPYFNAKIQPFEILFLPVFIVFFFEVFKERNVIFKTFNILDISLLLYIFYIFFNTIIFHFSFNTLMELAACIYTFCIYFFFSRIYFICKIKKEILVKAINWVLIVTSLNCLFGGILYYTTGIESYVMPYGSYPYLGDIVRFCGASVGPNIIISLLLVYGLFYSFLNSKKSSYYIWPILFVISCLTFSKEIIFLITVFLINKFLKIIGLQNSRRWIANYSVAFFILWLFFTFATFYVICKPPCSDISFSLGPSMSLTENLNYRSTGYKYLFNAAIEFIKQKPLIGVGLGNFYNEVIILQEKGFYPSHIAALEAHDLYWGLLAQLGLPFIIVMIMFVGALFRLGLDLEKLNSNLFKVFFMIIFYIGFEILGNCGAQNFRHYFIFLGIFSGLDLCIKYKNNIMHPLIS